MKEENSRNLIEIIKNPNPNGSLNENGEWIWEDIPDVPGDEDPSSEGPQSPLPEPGSTLSYTSNTTAVSLSLGAPSAWQTLETLSFINTRDQEVVKLDASFTLSWTTLTNAYANVGIDYQIVRNGMPIYSSGNIFNYEGKANAKNLEQISLFHIDNPGIGNYNYAMQIRVNQHNNTKDATQITKSELAATVYYGVQAKSYLYVSYIEDINAPNDTGFVAVVDPDTKKVIKTISVGRNPGALAKSPDGASVYVVNVQDETVSIIDTNTLTVTDTVSVGSNPTAVMVAPDNTKAYVANYGSQNVTIIDTVTRKVKATVAVKGSPFAFTAQPNSWFIFAATITEGDKGHAMAISVGTDQVSDLGSTTGLNRKYNPLVAKVTGIKMLFISPKGSATYRIESPTEIHYSYTYSTKNWTSAVHQPRYDYFYSMETFQSTTRGRLRVSDVNGGYIGPNEYPSFTGQSHIVISPDFSRVCISIEANDDQFAGLQIVNTAGNDKEIHFVEIPVAHKSVVTSDSSLAFVMEDSYVHPVDIINYTNPFPSIYIGGKVNDMVAAYQMTT